MTWLLQTAELSANAAQTDRGMSVLVKHASMFMEAGGVITGSEWSAMHPCERAAMIAAVRGAGERIELAMAEKVMENAVHAAAGAP